MDDSFGKNIHRRQRGEKKLLLTWNVTLESGSNDEMDETIVLWISPESGDEQDIRISTARMNFKDTIIYNRCALLLAKCSAENSDVLERAELSETNIKSVHNVLDWRQKDSIKQGVQLLDGHSLVIISIFTLNSFGCRSTH
jgi:hypothetical protein